MESNARVLNYYNHGTAAPTIQAMVDAETRRAHDADTLASKAKERTRKLERSQAKTKAREQEKAKVKAQASTLVKPATVTEAVEKVAPGISVFAILGTLLVSVLMVFVVLAQINFNETAAESVRLNILLNELSARHRALDLSFESAVDIKEVERYARDELGMSRPDIGQMIIINSTPRDTAMIISSGEERSLQGFGTFIRSLTDYFRR